MRTYSRYKRIKEGEIGSSTKADRTRLCPFSCRIKFILKYLNYVDYSELTRKIVAAIQLGKGNCALSTPTFRQLPFFMQSLPPLFGQFGKQT